MKQTPSAISHGLPAFSLLFSLLSSSGYETSTTMDELPGLFHAVIARLPLISDFLSQNDPTVQTSPLGLPRLRLCEFVVAFIRTSFACVMDRFVGSPVVPTIVVQFHTLFF